MIRTQTDLIDLFSNACCALSYAYIANSKEPAVDIIRAVERGYIDKDGYVSQPVAFLQYMGIDAKDIEKVYEYDKNIPMVTEFVFGTKQHFVVTLDGEVIYDPWPNSETIAKGHIHSYRRIIR